MDVRDANYYDLIANGLGNATYQEFVDTLLADKYNGLKVEGFAWDPYMQIDFNYNQIQAELGINTMPTYVDIDSPAVYKSTEGFQISTGKIPRFKHGFRLDEKILREQMIIAQRTGRFSNNMSTVMRRLLFDSTDKLIGGNYNGLTYQRDQMVGNGEFILSLENNPNGIKGIKFSANVPDKNKMVLSGDNKWWTNTETMTEGSKSNPPKNLMDMVKLATNAGLRAFHFEVDKATFDRDIMHSKLRMAAALIQYPQFTGDQLTQIAANMDDDVIKANLERKIKARIIVKDDIVSTESWNEATESIEKKQFSAFPENKWVLVPDGSLGNIKAVEPIVVPDPAARIAYFDGGRTVLKQMFNMRTNSQEIESELTALVVPDKPKYMYYLTVA